MKKHRSLLLFAAIFFLLAASLYAWQKRSESQSVTEQALDMLKQNGVSSFDGKKALQTLSSKSTEQSVQDKEKSAEREKLPAVDTEKTDDEPNTLEKAAGLALQGIKLFQGENGLEIWRLKASWAHLSQQGESIHVSEPHVRYALGDTGLAPEKTNPSAGAEDAAFLDVTARKGEITDHQRHVSLIDEVLVTRSDEKLRSPRMDYDSTTRIMTFPQGAHFENSRGHGFAAVLYWNLVNNEITGQDGIEVIIKSRSALAGKSDDEKL